MLTAIKKILSPTELPNAPCRWCLKRIGLVGHVPIPLCDACFRAAEANYSVRSPKGNLWERMMTEFDAEARKWVKRLQAAPTQMDVLAVSAEEAQKLVELKKAADRAAALGHDLKAKSLRLELEERTKRLNGFRTEATSLVKGLGDPKP